MFSLRDQKRYGSVGVTLIVLFSAMAAFAAGLVSDTSSGGQGVVVTDGYTVTDIVYGNSINTSSNNSSTDITSVTFKLYRDGENSQTPVSGDDTTVYVQLLPSANWTQCSVTVSPNVTCVPVSSQRISYAALTGMNIVAYDNTEEEPVSPQGASGEVTVTGGDNIYDIYIGPETWRVHEFRTVGTSNFTVSGGTLDVEYLVVAGGGGGGLTNGGAGGAGGLRTNVGLSPLTISSGSETVVVGAGGGFATSNAIRGSDGGASSFSSVSTVGGGGGGSSGIGARNGSNGGSGGGGRGFYAQSGGLGTAGEGSDGGAGSGNLPPAYGSGGGGGAGSAGAVGTSSNGGAGGDGVVNTITGTSVYYAGGGGGGNEGSSDIATGGLGGGGTGGQQGLAGTGGVDGLGGGGGGGGSGGAATNAGGDGGDGIVIIRYKVSDEFSPLSLSPALWLDASDTSTITESGGSVSQWDDKSGNGNHVSQATAANQPTTGTRTLNGLNVLTFTTSEQVALAADLDVGASHHVFLVLTPAAEVTAASSSQNVLLASITGGAVTLRLGVATGTVANERMTWLATGPGDFRSVVQNTSNIPAAAAIYSLNIVSYVGSIRRNGSDYDTARGGLDWDASLYPSRYRAIGATSSGFAGDVGELVIVNSALSGDQVSSMETYLATKWGI